MLLGMEYGEVEFAFEEREVAVTVKERMAGADAEGGDQAVDGLAYRVAFAAQGAIICGGSDGEFCAACFEDVQPQKIALHSGGGAIVGDALENFAEDYIRDPERLIREFPIQPHRLGICVATKIVDPDSGIDNYHAGSPSGISIGDRHSRYFAARP
jgi:hypothetical protein